MGQVVFYSSVFAQDKWMHGDTQKLVHRFINNHFFFKNNKQHTDRICRDSCVVCIKLNIT